VNHNLRAAVTIRATYSCLADHLMFVYRLEERGMRYEAIIPPNDEFPLG
jgi:hypothetical protein